MLCNGTENHQQTLRDTYNRKFRMYLWISFDLAKYSIPRYLSSIFKVESSNFSNLFLVQILKKLNSEIKYRL